MKPIGVIGIPFSWLYGSVIGVRNLFFETGFFVTMRPPLPVVSIGNIAAGGTGKTPVTAYVCGMLASRGLRVTIVSRGYGRKKSGAYLVSDGKFLFTTPGEAGDEAYLLAKSFLGLSEGRVSVVVSERRTDGARIAHEVLHADCVVLDDGFQHRWLERMLDIVLIHAADLRRPRLIPAGNQREPLRSLRRAGVICITGSESIEEYAHLKGECRHYTSAFFVRIEKRAQSVMRMDETAAETPESVQGRKVVVTAGIARAESFINTVSELGAIIVGRRFFKDHYWYSSEDCASIQQLARETGASLILTTEKDAVRMAALARKLSDEWRYVRIGAIVLEGKEEFERAIGDAVKI